MINHPNRSRSYPDNTLASTLRKEYGAHVYTLWEMRGPKDTQIAWMTMYQVAMPARHVALVFVQTHKGGGWDAFTSNASGDIDKTVKDVADRLSVEPS